MLLLFIAATLQYAQRYLQALSASPKRRSRALG
jgi:hypothetical protein